MPRRPLQGLLGGQNGLKWPKMASRGHWPFNFEIKLNSSLGGLYSLFFLRAVEGKDQLEAFNYEKKLN